MTMTVSQGAHPYTGQHVGRASRQDSKIRRGGFRPISIDRLLLVLAAARKPALGRVAR